MSSKLSIRNTDVLRFILREFNNSSFKNKIKFSIAQWQRFTDETKNYDSLLITSLALKDDGFDVDKRFDEETYISSEETFVPMNIPAFNGEPTALPQGELKENVYDTTIDFLVYIDNVPVREIINLAIEEVRSNLIQKFTTFEVDYVDLENKNSAQRIKETLKVVVTTGSMEYGEITSINGKNYMTYHLDITMLFTNKGEFANQNIYKLGCDSIRDEENKVIMFPINPLNWHWGTTTAHDSAQLLNDHELDDEDNASETLNIPKNTSYAFSFDIQMDFKHPLLRKLYIDSKRRKKGNGTEIFHLLDETYEYNETTKQFEIPSDLRFERKLYIGLNQPNEELSKGEKIIWTVSFAPAYIDIETENGD